MRRRLLFTVLVVLVSVAIAASLGAPSIAIGAIHAYQRHLAPVAAAVGLECRFTPSCSRYAEVVIARDGVVRGGWKAIARIARCNPLTPRGTTDQP